MSDDFVDRLHNPLCAFLVDDAIKPAHQRAILPDFDGMGGVTMAEAAAEIIRLRAKVDAVYSERNRLAAAFARMALAAGFKAGKGVDPDETKWPVVYVDTPNGQVSWHIAEADQGVLEGMPQYNGEWDGKFTARDPAWSVWPAAIRAAAGEGK